MGEMRVIRVKVYAGPLCYTEDLDDDGFMPIEEGSVLDAVLKKLKYPFVLKKLGIYLVNYQKVPLDTRLQDGDVISLFTPLQGG